MTFAKLLLESKFFFFFKYKREYLQKNKYLKSFLSSNFSYHFGALTTQGRLLTWGRYSSGALGLGYAHSSGNQTTPQLVEALNNMFVFAIGFGGVHSGCLAIPRHTLVQQQHI